jgi:hypothetical protein
MVDSISESRTQIRTANGTGFAEWPHKMNTDPVPPTNQQPNSVPMPDPVTESEVNIDLKWTADARTRLAIQRQTKLMGFESADDYLHKIHRDSNRQP